MKIGGSCSPSDLESPGAGNPGAVEVADRPIGEIFGVFIGDDESVFGDWLFDRGKVNLPIWRVEGFE